jgi:hypothetical protein
MSVKEVRRFCTSPAVSVWEYSLKEVASGQQKGLGAPMVRGMAHFSGNCFSKKFRSQSCLE